MSDRVIYGNLTLVPSLGPVGFPVSVPDAKDQSKVLQSAEDHLIESYVEAATLHLDGRDGILGRALLPQTWDYALPRFPSCSHLDLPLAPVQSIVSITYKDANGAPATFSAGDYALGADKDWQPRVNLAYGKSWPGTREDPDAVTIRAVFGYSLVPMPIRQAILLLAAHWFENREPVNIGSSVSELPFGVRALLEPYLRTSF